VAAIIVSEEVTGRTGKEADLVCRLPFGFFIQQLIQLAIGYGTVKLYIVAVANTDCCSSIHQYLLHVAEEQELLPGNGYGYARGIQRRFWNAVNTIFAHFKFIVGLIIVYPFVTIYSLPGSGSAV